MDAPSRAWFSWRVLSNPNILTVHACDPADDSQCPYWRDVLRLCGKVRGQIDHGRTDLMVFPCSWSYLSKPASQSTLLKPVTVRKWHVRRTVAAKAHAEEHEPNCRFRRLLNHLSKAVTEMRDRPFHPPATSRCRQTISAVPSIWPSSS